MKMPVIMCASKLLLVPFGSNFNRLHLELDSQTDTQTHTDTHIDTKTDRLRYTPRHRAYFKVSQYLQL